MSTNSWEDARKCYLTSLRSKLRKAYGSNSQTRPDGRWLNGFMAAGFHSGLVSLKDLLLEHKNVYRKVNGESMGAIHIRRLELRLTKLGSNFEQ